MSGLYRGIAIGVVLCVAAGSASAQQASEDVQQAALAPPSASECLQTPAPDLNQRIKACTAAIDSGQLRGRERPMAYLARAAAYTASGDMARATIDNGHAVVALSAIMDPEAPDPNLLFLRATTYHALGDADPALADYNLAIRLSPFSPIAFIDRGILLTAYKQQYMLAIMDFDRALELAPGNPDALAHRAEAVAARAALQARQQRD